MYDELNAAGTAQGCFPVGGLAEAGEFGFAGQCCNGPQDCSEDVLSKENQVLGEGYRSANAREYGERCEQMASVLGFKGENDEETMAHAYGITPEGWRTEQERIREEMFNSPEFTRLKAENEALKSKEYDRIIGSDLKEIQGVDPQVKSLDDLGERFLRLRAAGVDNLTAYHAVKAAASKKPVAQMGDIKPGAAEKGFFTCDEVKAMSPAEVSKNYEEIEKSMSKWR